MDSDPPAAALSAFLSNNPGAQSAARSLRAGAEVAVSFADGAEDRRIYLNNAGQIVLEAAKAIDPDFALHVTAGAIRSICSRKDGDLGDLGVAFFEHVVSRQQESKIYVTVHSGLGKLTRRGWLNLLAQGGPKVMGWMVKRGLRGPGAVAAALGRLRK